MTVLDQTFSNTSTNMTHSHDTQHLISCVKFTASRSRTNSETSSSSLNNNNNSSSTVNTTILQDLSKVREDLRVLCQHQKQLEQQCQQTVKNQSLQHELQRLQEELAWIQQDYAVARSIIQQYQQWVLSTHAQVATAKQNLTRAHAAHGQHTTSHDQLQRQQSRPCSISISISSPDASQTTALPALIYSTSASSTSSSASSSTSDSSEEAFICTCTSCSSPSSFSDSDEKGEEMQGQPQGGVPCIEHLEQEHSRLGAQLSLLLQEKAQAEEIKKQWADRQTRTKNHIKAIESKLSE